MNRRTTGILIALLGLIFLVVGIFSIRRILKTSLVPPEIPTQPETRAMESVVIASRDIKEGYVLQLEDLDRVEVPVELIPREAFRELDNVAGRMTKVPLVSGEMVLNHHLADPTNISHDVGYTIESDRVLMAFPASDLMSSLGILQRGDLIDILASLEQEAEVTETDEETGGDEPPPGEEAEKESTLFTFNAMQAMEISAVVVDVTYEENNQAAVPLQSVQGDGDEQTDEQTPASRQPSSINVRAYLLAVDPQDALVLKHLIDLGAKFDLVLRAPNADQLFDLQPVVPEYLNDRYELEIRR